MEAIRALPSIIVLAAFMLVISSARDSRPKFDSATGTTVRIDDEGIVREIRTHDYIPKTSIMEISLFAAWSSSKVRAGRRKDISGLRSHFRINIARS